MRGGFVIDPVVDTGDVLQEALIHFPRAFRALVNRENSPVDRDSFHTRDFFRYSAMLIRRELIDLAKRGWPAGRLPSDAEAWAVGNDTYNPERLALWAEFHGHVEKLPSDLRDVFDLHFYQEFSLEETADLLGVSKNVVRTRWRKARLALIEAMPSSPGFNLLGLCGGLPA